MNSSSYYYYLTFIENAHHYNLEALVSRTNSRSKTRRKDSQLLAGILRRHLRRIKKPSGQSWKIANFTSAVEFVLAD
jgi:hypothetical protein